MGLDSITARTPWSVFTLLLEKLRLHRIPLVLVHADRLRYPAPTVENIVPDNARIGKELQAWLHKYHSAATVGKLKTVLLAMQDEEEPTVFPRLRDFSPSLRNERKKRLWDSLAGTVRARIDNLPSYEFQHALEVWRKHQTADLFLCLSDQIAVALKHLIIASGSEHRWQHRVVGFDGSPLAMQAEVASFKQDLYLTGRKAVEALARFFQTRAHFWAKGAGVFHAGDEPEAAPETCAAGRDGTTDQFPWPPFREKLVPVRLVQELHPE